MICAPQDSSAFSVLQNALLSFLVVSETIIDLITYDTSRSGIRTRMFYDNDEVSHTLLYFRVHVFS